ncbi:MAG: TolC family protein [Melioribacteraceae bacterium]|nr:TolC family protein [Melioribacteraceae bacterium]
MKKIILIQLLAFITLFAQQKTYTLEESIRVGIINSKVIKISESKVKYADAQVNEITSKFYPRLNFNASYTRLSDVDPFEVSVPIFPTPIKIQDAILNNYGVKLSFSQPLFTGFKLSSLKKSASKNYDALSDELKSEMNNESFKIQTAFWNLLKSEEALKLIKKNISLVEELVKDSENLFKSGMVTKNNLLSIKVRLSNLQLARINTENMVKINKSFFLQGIGENLNEEIKINADLETEVFSLEPFNSLLETALQQRSELSAVNHQLKATGFNIEGTKSDWYPNLSLFSNVYYSNPNQRLMPLEDKFKATWDVGIALNWSLWNSGETDSKIIQAEEIKKQAEKKAELLKEQIELEVYNAYLSIIGSKEKVKVSELTVEQAKENYRVSKNQFDEQMITSTDLINAEASLLEAEINLINTIVDYKLTKTKLNKAIGNRIY